MDAVEGLVGDFITRGVDVNGIDGSSGRTPLHVAAASGVARAVDVLLLHGANAGQRDACGMLALDLAKRHHPALSAQHWSPDVGQGPRSQPVDRRDMGLVVPAFEPLLRATRLSAAFSVDQWWHDAAGRPQFDIVALRTISAAPSRVSYQRWIASADDSPVLQYLRGADTGSWNPALSLPVHAISAVLWAVDGPPRAIIRLRTYDQHIPDLRRQIVRVEFLTQGDRVQFLNWVLPFVVITIEKPL